MVNIVSSFCGEIGGEGTSGSGDFNSWIMAVSLRWDNGEIDFSSCGGKRRVVGLFDVERDILLARPRLCLSK